ncbi:methyltransferase [Planotetraspora phitsanulokensis]|uniref:O-methyltransferase n=1 Tax=Planotetraspora phitsanulokensis TaxID=575192 RepID=A0A8J3U7C2_9ACTN|nr:methyltransferase [Planotetraspora phitsanulokensis]GII39953.1 O-methyltransferase [Planotetraspora phitsanulokensis]
MTTAQTPDPAPVMADYGRMMSMVTGFWVSQVVRAAAVFNIAEHVAGGRTTAAEIAEAESADPDAVRRLLRTWASLGLLTSGDGVHFAGTSLLATLHPDSPHSLHHLALSQAAPGHWQPWGRFPDAVRSGATQGPAAYGSEVWDYLAGNPEEALYFTRSLANITAMTNAEVARQIGGAGLTVDVGGADGSLIRELMRNHPGMRGVVLDRPDVVPAALEAAKADGLDDRFDVVGGDFFQDVPPADLYLLRYIVHDWDDEQAVRILANCRGSLNEGGRVAVVELLVGPVGTPGLAPVMDANMLVMTGGRERDLAEYDALFTQAGLRRTRVAEAGNMVVIEAVAV